MSIPVEETRRIRMIKVFAVTAFFSVFAYVWLLIVLVLISPDIVELWEGVVTLLLFFILVCLAYLADKGEDGIIHVFQMIIVMIIMMMMM